MRDNQIRIKYKQSTKEYTQKGPGGDEIFLARPDRP
jgi:hypothetical protein